MNTTPRSPTPINTASYPSEFQQLIREKSENIGDRQYFPYCPNTSLTVIFTSGNANIDNV
jgi:hypothetical protein